MIHPKLAMRITRTFALVVLCVAAAAAQVRVAQISDTHLGSQKAPLALDNLRKAIDMVNARQPDVVIVTGDIAEHEPDWQVARSLFAKLHAPVYCVPGNHDVHAADLARYRRVFGRDYYTFRVKNVTFVAIDSQLLGNFDDFTATQIQPLPEGTRAESEKMLQWMENESDKLAARRPREQRGGAAAPHGEIVVGLQHVPLARNGSFPEPFRPYWVVNEPYRSRELDMLKRLGIHHLFAGHWHQGMVFEADGITWHIAPSTARVLFEGTYGFALHTITRNGDVKTEFVDIH